MKIFYFLLLLIFASCANDIVKNNLSINEANEISKTDAAFLDEETENNTISGLKIISKHSQKFGNQIYVVSDSYSEKDVFFYNEDGKKVYSKKTTGSPINLSKLKKGTYTIQIIEGEKTETREITID